MSVPGGRRTPTTGPQTTLNDRHMIVVWGAPESVEGAHWVDRGEAEQEIRISWDRARDSDAAPRPEADPGDT